MADKSFDEMSSEEQKDWWFGTAKQVCLMYKMPTAKIEWLAHTHNAVFILNYKKNKYVLRLNIVGGISSEQLRERSEAKFLIQLREDTNLVAPYPILASNNQYYQVFADASHTIDIGSRISAILFRYVDGSSALPEKVTLAQVNLIGSFLANFHLYTQKYKMDGVDRHRYSLTRIMLTWHGLFSKGHIYYPGDENMIVFSDEQLSVMDAVAEKVKQAMDELGQGENEFGLLHGDLLLKNILFHEGEVRALDFEYCGWGYYLYDLTPLLWQLKPQERYPQLEQALWNGYTSIRPLTVRHRELLETFIAGRQVASMRWIAANQQNPHVVGKVEEILTQRTAELQAFLETGKLNRR